MTTASTTTRLTTPQRSEYEDEPHRDRARAPGRGRGESPRQPGRSRPTDAAPRIEAGSPGRAGLPPGRARSRAGATRSRPGHLDPGTTLDRYQGRSPGKEVLPG